MKSGLLIFWIGSATAFASACGSDATSRRDKGDHGNSEGNGSPRGGSPPAPSGSKGSQEGPGDDGADGVSGGSPVSGQGPIVLGFFGGFTSCGQKADGSPDPTNQGLSDAFDRAVSSARNTASRDPLTIQSCFDTDPTRVKLVVSTDPHTVKSVPLAQLPGEISTFLKAKAPGGRLQLVGHSYGGWTVLSLAKDIDPQYSIQSLVTIDPISVKDCTPDVFLGGFLGGGGEACRRAPKDFGEENVAKIKARVGKWVNFYQIAAPALHSGPMTGAENIQKDHPANGLAPHSDFLADTAVIERIGTVAGGGK